MNKEFFQLILDDTVERRVFAAFSEFRKMDKIGEKERAEAGKRLRKEIFFQAAVETDQDPEEIWEMIIESFDKSFLKLKDALKETYLLIVVPEFQKAKEEKENNKKS